MRNRFKQGVLGGILWLVAGLLSAEPLVVYSGAGLRPAVQPLLEQFEQQSGIKVLVEYGGMGQLLTRYETTRRGDVIISGTHFYTDQLIAKHLMETAWPLAFHGAVVGVYPGSADKVQRFEDLANPGLKLALGDPKSMALGRTADDLLDASGLGDAIRANVVVRGTSVQQLALYVVQGDVDAAILGVTAAVQQGERMRVVQIPARLYDPERVTAGVLTATTQQAHRAQQLVDFLKSPAGLAHFATAGFPLLPEGYQPRAEPAAMPAHHVH